MVEKDSDGLADSVSQLSARFDRLETLVTECLTREKPAVGQCAASAGPRTAKNLCRPGDIEHALNLK